ncbi:MAG: nucleotidyltransferase family protein [Chloroflexota bacterium]
MELDDLLTRLRELQPYLQKQYRVKTLEVFGSYARGEENAESDLDLLVTFEIVPSLFKFLSLELFLSDQLGIKVDLIIKDNLKPDLAPAILKEAKPV